jgi:hypothetical protein
MKRRKFFTSALTASCLATPLLMSIESAAINQKGDQPQPEYYELRLYHMLVGPKQKLLNDFLRDVAIPAMNRNGMAPIGAFTVMFGSNNLMLYLLIPHKSPESLATASSRLLADREYLKAGAAIINAPISNPTYERIESSLLAAFPGMPKLEVPATTAGNKPRIFELRIYESHSEQAGKRKIEMFHAGREIDIFRRTGLQPVFFGETLIGPRLPNLTYMLTFENMEARDQHWARFSGDAEWKKLKENPYYADTVSNITDIILRPTAYSQI